MNKYSKPEIEILNLTIVDVIETSGQGTEEKPGLNVGGEGNNDNPMEWSSRSLWDNK